MRQVGSASRQSAAGGSAAGRSASGQSASGQSAAGQWVRVESARMLSGHDQAPPSESPESILARIDDALIRLRSGMSGAAFQRNVLSGAERHHVCSLALSRGQLEVLLQIPSVAATDLSSIAVRLGLTKPVVSRRVAGLRRRSLVAERVTLVNRRLQTIRLTEAGRRIREMVKEARCRCLADDLDRCSSEELEVLARGLELLVWRLNKRAASTADR